MSRSPNPRASGVSTVVRPRRAGWLSRWVLLVLLVSIGLMVAFSLTFSSGGQSPESHVGHRRLSQQEAETMVLRWCSRFAGESVELMHSEARRFSEKGADADFWEVLCRTERHEYTMQVDARSKEPLMYNRESTGTTASEHEATIPTLALSKSLEYVKACLQELGVPLPSNAVLVHDNSKIAFSFRCPLSGGRMRLLQVHIDPADGRMDAMRNSISRAGAKESGKRENSR